MADSQRSDRSNRHSIKTGKQVRSQKIIQLSPTDTRPPDIPEDSELPREHIPPTRSHTPGHLSTKSQDKKKKASELALRQRSQSLSQKDQHSESPRSSSKHPPTRSATTPKPDNPLSPPVSSTPASAPGTPDPRRPLNIRSTSAIASKPNKEGNPSPVTISRNTTPAQRPPRGPHVPFPPLPDPKTAPDVEPAPASGMYWSRAPVSGASHTSLRAHTSTLIGSNIYIFGGCDSRSCFNELYVVDADAFYFSSPHVCGDIPVPLRAMTCTAVGKKLIVFGGGDGPVYYNDVYVLDTVNFRWTKPIIGGDRQPSKRRAHTACLYRNGIYIFGGGDGVRALNDVWRLDVADTNKMSWKLISAPSSVSSEDENKPKARGYHTSNMVGSKLIIFGGSDGGECFRDVWVFDVETKAFSPVRIPLSYPRLSHTATIVGSYLFVIGGHDGVEYSNEVLLLNLVTMVWDKRKIYGIAPKPRGYHGAVLHDSRLVVVGGFDGSEVFADVQVLELAVHAYYSQISHFSIDV
ncbi:Tip elongation aberrant protein [Lachnellula hyalina]|uniref:Tip elongation aberrant protein n=1 Tax=Lachnellula hyalina TaxID=1316788 RepID=A0A8H8U138_9HELO|nr:Tip elongation aberrant protein [Lachnellula hyalina]TVY29995.1 Tip elongation aberrant protein [Lachnellula hyalina]